VTETVLSGIEQRMESALAHLKGLAEDDLPAIAAWLGKVRTNPLVTAFGSVIPGTISDDTMAVLNGLLPILVGLGAKITPPAAPDPTSSSPGWAVASGPSAGPTEAPGSITGSGSE
jgi:hypothetical protein